MTNTTKTQLDNILKAIKAVNDSRKDGSTISQDQENVEIMNILSEYNLADDAEQLEEAFGDGLNLIRDAEQGIY